MKPIKVTDVSQIKNELNKYRKGKKLDINLFNQAARLAWLGKITMSRLDPEDPDNRAQLLYVHPPEGLTEHFLDIEEEMLTQIHILDGEQAEYLAEILKEGLEARVRELQALNRKDFYFGKFFKPKDSPAAGQPAAADPQAAPGEGDPAAI